MGCGFEVRLYLQARAVFVHPELSEFKGCRKDDLTTKTTEPYNDSSFVSKT